MSLTKCSYVLSLLLLFSIASCSRIQPKAIPWSNKTYGPDGPWWAIKVSIGTPPVDVDLYMSHRGSSTPFATIHRCSGTDCYNQPNPYACHRTSNTARTYKGQLADELQKVHTVFPGTVPLNGSSVFCTDTIRFPGTSLRVQNAGFEAISNPVYNNPLGNAFPATVGGLSTGGPGPGIREVLGYTVAPQPLKAKFQENIIYQDLYRQGQIPSPGWAMHVGSVKQNIKPSLYFGGYDQSRFLGHVVAQPLTSEGNLGIRITNIGIYNYSITDNISVPFNKSSTTGLLRLASGERVNKLPIVVSLTSSHMILPAGTCHAIADFLPVDWWEAWSVYRWKTNSLAYKELMRSTTYLNFTIETSSESPAFRQTSIAIPIQLLNLTMSEPNTPYEAAIFPCQSAYSGFGLGRAFLQAASIGFNWKAPHEKPTKNNLGYWYIAQAPGPDHLDPFPLAFSKDQTQLTNIGDPWVDTWKQYWKAIQVGGSLPGRAQKKGSSQDFSLSTGAQIGIALGVAVAIVLIIAALAYYLIFRKRILARKLQAALDSDSTSDPDEKTRAELEEVAAAKRMQELCGKGVLNEIGEPVERTELPASPVPTYELDGRSIKNSPALTLERPLPPTPPPKDGVPSPSDSPPHRPITLSEDDVPSPIDETDSAFDSIVASEDTLRDSGDAGQRDNDSAAQPEINILSPTNSSATG